MKKTIIIIAFLLFAPAKSLFAGQNICDGTLQNPCIVRDTQENQVTLKSFRTAKMLSDAYKGNTEGLAALKLSGSAASSQKDFATIYDFILKNADSPVKTIIAVDLRQETHGYLNNDAVNLTENSNWINLQKDHETILQDEARWLQALASFKEIPNVLEAHQFKAKEYADGKNIPVIEIADEKTVVQKIGFQYFRLTTPDHRPPLDSEVDRFIHFMDKLSKDVWLHIHCRGGKGRTTVFMAMVDMLKNAHQVSFEDIIKRQAAVAPFNNLFDYEDRTHPEYIVYYKARLEFLKEFYRYSRDRLNGYAGDWTSWKTQH